MDKNKKDLATIVELPEPSTETLGASPLELVVFQGRHEGRPAVSDPAIALRIQNDIRHDYPTLEQASAAEMVVEAGPSGFQTSGGEVRPGWRLRSKDHQWTVILMPDFFALESTGYTTWTEFNSRLEDLVEVIHSAYQPALIQRIGLRYIDRIVYRQASKPGHWVDLLEPSLLGLAANPDLMESVIGAQTFSHLDLGDAQVVLRSSCTPDPAAANGYATVLDTDCFDGRARAFDVLDIKQTAQKLHRRALQVFQAVVKPELLESLKS
ncbi:TIGR04255 family protein [Arthrobacter sp. PsM3]|uniref:TIGR04255 family protein n=1 Tax=Arthrobacter sp. PsM3 TaxID=3030531 RepID=UPI00263B3FD3|nr:TIGR04255 family protein [Arthrobacter sp. PsM3]MDN4643917.1 TIGR04255 family protein [Arthrobacter sp. PsM3]